MTVIMIFSLILCVILGIAAFMAAEIALARFMMLSLLKRKNILMNLGTLLFFSMITYTLFHCAWCLYFEQINSLHIIAGVAAVSLFFISLLVILRSKD